MSRPRKNSLTERTKHEHYFQSVEGKNEEKCAGLVVRYGEDVECGVVRLTPQEYSRRAQAWDQYYFKDFDKTEFYALFQVMQGAFKDGNEKLRKETLLRIRQLGRNELPLPPFEDCVCELHYGRLIIQKEEPEVNQDDRVIN